MSSGQGIDDLLGGPKGPLDNLVHADHSNEPQGQRNLKD